MALCDTERSRINVEILNKSFRNFIEFFRLTFWKNLRNLFIGILVCLIHLNTPLIVSSVRLFNWPASRVGPVDFLGEFPTLGLEAGFLREVAFFREDFLFIDFVSLN